VPEALYDKGKDNWKKQVDALKVSLIVSRLNLFVEKQGI
jgi:hypothetical protein